MKKSGKLGAAALLLCGTLALSAMGMGFAKWQTTLHAEGDVAASGKWDVVLTDASVTLSNGAEIRENDADYSLQNVIAANKKGQACIEAAVSRTKVTSYPTTGTQNSRFAVSSWLWLVDTTRFDLSKLGTLDTEQRRLTMLDGLEQGYVIRLGDDQTAPDGTKIQGMRAWNYYRNKTDYFGDTAAQDKILDGLVAQSDTLLKTLRPDTFRNYALVCMAADGTDHCDHLQFVIASMGRADGQKPAAVTRTETEAAYSDVEMALPGAWAAYTLTVTNRGTANANLSDAVIVLEGDDTAQLQLDAPDLAGDILAPGQSCTIQVVVQAVDQGKDTLDAAGTLKINLPYLQDTVEAAPEAGHLHN